MGSRVTPSPVRVRAGVSLFFFTNGAMMAGILPRYPEVKAAFELSNTAFGFMVAVGPFASILASALPAPLIRRFGAQRVSLAGTIAMAVAMSLAGFAPHCLVFAFALAMAGFFDAIVDAAQNVHGVRVEDTYGKTIINSLHALWSLGAASGGLIGAFAASRHIPLSIHLTGVAITLVGLATLATRMGRVPDGGRSTLHDHKKLPAKLPKGAWTMILPLVFLAVSGVLIEDVASNWAALYLVQVIGVPPGVGGLGYAVMLVSQFVGRILGDPATDEWGHVVVIRTGGAIIAVGGLLAVAVLSLPAALIGYALAGYGCATVVPAVYAAAGRLPDFPEGAGVTLVSWLMRAGFLMTSPIIGVVADLTSLRVGLCLIVVSGVAVFYLAKAVRPPSRDPAFPYARA
jgi:MFS family permease